MGGYGALINGLRFSERFSKIGMLSPALGMSRKDDNGRENNPVPPGEILGTLGTWEAYAGSYTDYEWVLRNASAGGKAVPEMFLAIGQDDFLMKEVRQFRTFCGEIHVPLKWLEGEGNHDHTFWKRAMDPLFQFLTGKEGV